MTCLRPVSIRYFWDKWLWFLGKANSSTENGIRMKVLTILFLIIIMDRSYTIFSRRYLLLLFLCHVLHNRQYYIHFFYIILYLIFKWYSRLQSFIFHNDFKCLKGCGPLSILPHWKHISANMLDQDWSRLIRAQVAICCISLALSSLI